MNPSAGILYVLFRVKISLLWDCLYVLLGGALLMSGCKLEDFRKAPKLPKYSARWAAPMGRLSYTTETLLKGKIGNGFRLEKNEDELLVLRYSWQERLLIDSKVVDMPTYTFTYEITQTSNVPAPISPPLVQELRRSAAFAYNATDGSRIDSLIYKSATMEVAHMSSYTARMRTSLSFPGLKAPGSRAPLLLNFDSNYTGTSPLEHSERRNLRNYHFSFLPTAEGSGFNNSFRSVFNISAEQRANETLDPGDQLTFTIHFTNTSFSAIHGRLKQRNIQLTTQNLPVSSLQKLENIEGIQFNEANMAITFDNFYGLPLAVSFDGMGFAEDSSTLHALRGRAVSERYFVAAPLRSEIGSHKRSTIVFNRSNSNLAELLQERFTSLHIPIQATTNPSPPHPQHNDNFIIDGQYVDMRGVLEAPLDVVLSELGHISKFGNDYAGNKDDDFVKTATLRIVTDNFLPLEGIADFQLISREGVMLHEIESYPVISAPAMDATGRATEAIRKVTDVPLDGEALEHFKRSDSIFVVVRFSSPKDSNEQPLNSKLFSGLELNIRLAVMLNVETDLSEEN